MLDADRGDPGVMPSKLCRILVVDDEPAMREVLLARIERWGFEVRAASCVRQARDMVTTLDPHVVITDLVLPDATGMDLLRTLHAGPGAPTVYMITAYGTIDSAVEAIKLGATEFLTKPLDYVDLRRRLEAVEDELSSAATVSTSVLPGPEFEGVGKMVGHGPAMHRLAESIGLAASSDAPTLIVGESGTGKELVARTIAETSARAHGPFVAVNAAAFPDALVEAEFFGYERGAFTGANGAKPGLFEQAHGGTLFLDEVTEMPIALQSKFLRVLEDGRVRRIGGREERACDVRLLAATNRDPMRAVEEGRLRHDVLFRIDVFRIDVPALRDRLEDLEPLVHHFIAECSARYRVSIEGISDGALEQLRGHRWPGNVRELRNIIERAFVTVGGGTIGPQHLGVGEPTEPGHGEPSSGIVLPFGVTIAEAERIVILETLKRTGNNKAETARRLGLDVKTVRNKLKTFSDWPP